MALVDNLVKQGWLKTPRIIESFKKIKRVDFLPDDKKSLGELDEALPIGHNQTISQPLVVAFMLELLDPREGDKILDIGSGSGWTTALLAEIVGLKGKVKSIEVVPELTQFGKKNIGQYNFLNKGIVESICADGSKGYQKEAPYDKILVSASAVKVEDSWKKQLKKGGRIVAPMNTSIWLFIKKNEAEFKEKEYPGFVFVPLVKQSFD